MPDNSHIAFICSGNICRSPMAEIIARDILLRLGVSVHVSSAGTLGIEDHPASSHAVEAVKRVGLDLSGHRSQGATAAYLRDISAIVVMSEHHAIDIRAVDPDCDGRIHRLWEHTTTPGRLDEIRDPMGCSLRSFLDCRDDIRECLENWLLSFVESGVGGT